MLHNAQEEFIKEAVHLQDLPLVQFNLAEQFYLFLAQVSSLCNWEDALANPITNNNTANRPTSSTHSQSKPHQSENTNEQLAKVLGRLANTLNFNQTPSLNTNIRGIKACIPDIFSSTESDKLNNFLFQCCLYFHANLVQFNMDIVKINFVITYLTGVAQD